MEVHERTRDMFEVIDGYLRPLPIPLPAPGDLESMERMGLIHSKASHFILKTFMALSGFNGFQKGLPEKVEGILKSTNSRGAFLFSPLISATLALEDAPGISSPVERAATLIWAVRNLYEDIMSARFEPDKYGSQMLEMGKYSNLFSTGLIVEGKISRVFKSADFSRITVIIARRFYSVELWKPGTEVTIDQLKNSLKNLIHQAQSNRRTDENPSPGILTFAKDRTQIKAFSQIQRNPDNRETLNMLRHSFFTVCLDVDTSPGSFEEAAFLAHRSNFGNRWNHASLQLVVFGNAKACVLCNFSAYLDGNNMMRAAAEIQKRAVQYSSPGKQDAGTTNGLPHVKELKWRINKNMLRNARRDLLFVLDFQPATYTIENIGTDFFADHPIQLVQAFIIALQFTAKRLTGKMIKISQFLTMSKYRFVGLLTTVVTTPEVMQLVDSLEDRNMSVETRQKLLWSACKSQSNVCRKARRYLPLPKILNMFLRSTKSIRRFYVMSLYTITMILLKQFRMLRSVQREIIVSHPLIHPEVPLVGRPGVRLPYVKYFGLHYQIYKDKIVITFMPGVNWTIPNSELIADLRESLIRVRAILDNKEL